MDNDKCERYWADLEGDAAYLRELYLKEMLEMHEKRFVVSRGKESTDFRMDEI